MVTGRCCGLRGMVYKGEKLQQIVRLDPADKQMPKCKREKGER